MSKLFNWAAARIVAAFAFALCFATPLVSWADAITTVNPVTGETETYTYKFVGTDSVWNNAANWQDSNGSNPSAVPAASGSDTWDPILFDQAENQSIAIGAALSVEGWNLRMGLYNGASVQLDNLVKLQSDTATWITADSSSHCTIAHMANKKLVGANPLCLYSANQGGIAWTEELSSSGNGNGTPLPFHYYLAGNGTVAYNGGIAAAAGGAHVIKQADVTLSGTSQVSSKTLVSFTSSSMTFTADAAIKVYGIGGTTLVDTVNTATVNTTGSTTLTEDSAVGSVELVQTPTGIVLYYVDGDPADVNVEEKTYKPSININFTHSGGNLTTSADVGLAPYTVPGTVWNNYAVPANGATSTQTSVYSIDATGTKSLVSGATVSISGTRGSHRCNSLTAASDLRHGYIDESVTAGQNTPTVVVSGIPFERYTVVVYTAADTENATFNYITVNGTDYTYVNGKLATGTSAWGNAGAADSANALAEGVNVLVSPVLRGSTATIVGHKASNTCRGNIAAVQIVEYTPEIGENDLVIELDGDKTHTFEEAKTYDTVYVTGSGTLTFAGTASTATTLDISGSAAVNMNGSSLTPTAVTGTGTAIYTGVLPAEGLGWTASAWYGTVWIKNYTTKVASFQSNKYGNAASTLRLTGMNGYFDYKWTGDNATAKYSQNVAIELVDDGDTPAFTYNDGWEKTVIYFAKLKGAGTLRTAGSGNKQTLYFANADEFTGTFDLAAQKIQIGGDEQANKDTTAGNGKLIVAGTSAMTANVKTANGGIYITGTLNGSIATTNTVTISGTMNITGAVTTEAIISVENGGALNIANGGTLKLTRNTDDDGINPYAGVTIKSGATCTIASGGTITTDNSVTSTYYQFVVNGSMTVAGAFTTVADVAVNAGGSLTITGTMKAYWGIANSGTITLNGIDNVPAYASGYPTTITNSDTGVVKLTSTGSVDDSTKDYSAITGTGTIEYCGSSWRSLPQTMFAPTLSVVANQADGVVAKHNNTVIGSLSGEKNLRSDLGDSGKTLTIKQAKDGVWSGIFKGGTDRLATIVVAPGDSTTGTLTLAGTQDQANWTDALTVSGSVNLSGTWQGDTTVSGTFGGTGTLTGNLTFSDGATFKAFASDDEDGLVVSGTVGYPAEGTVTVDVSAIEPEADVALIKAAGLNRDKFALATGAPEGYALEVVDGVLTLTVPHVTITVPAIANATVTVKIGDNTIGTSSGDYNVAPDSVVTVTYAAMDGYEISGTTEYTIDTSKSETTFDPAGTTEVKQYVAQIYGGEKYTTLQASVDAAVRNSKIIVLANETDGATIPSKDISFYIYTGAFTTGEILDATGDFITTRTTEEISISDDYHADKVTAVKYSVAAAFMAVTIDGMRTLYGQANANDALTAANAGPIGTTVEFLSGDPASYAEHLPMFDYDSETRVYTKVADPVAAVYSGVLQLSVHRTLAEAVAAAENGLTVKLLDGIELESAAEIASGKSITIDLNGKTVAGPAGGYAFSNAGGVTIVGNGTVTGAGGIVTNTASGATVAISNGTYTVTGDLFGNVEGGTIAVSGGTFDRDVNAFCADGYEAKQDGDNWVVSKKSGIDPTSGTEITVDTSKTPEEQAAEAQAAAAAMDVKKTAGAASVDQAIWNGYFTKTAEKVNDVWVAKAELNPAVVLPVDGAEEKPLTDMLESVVEAAVDTTGETTAAVPTKAGLYYWISGATEVNAASYTPGKAELGDGTKKPLARPNLTGENGKAFFKVCVDVVAPTQE